MTFADVFRSETVLGGITLAAMGGAYKMGKKILSDLRETLDETRRQTVVLAEHTKTLENQDIQLEKCNYELHTNGGRSLRDAIVKIENMALMNVAQNDALIEDREMAAYRSDPQGRCLFVSKRWTQMAGMTRDEAMAYGGYGWNNAVHAKDRDRISKAWATAMEKGIPFVERFAFQTGAEVETRATPVRRDGAVIAWIGESEFLHGTEKLA